MIEGIITVTPLVIWLVFTLPTRGLKLYALPTWTSIHYPPHPQTLEKHPFIKNQNITRIKNTNHWIFSSWALETWKSLVLSWGFDFSDRAFMWGWGSDFGLSWGIEYSKIDYHQVWHFCFMWVGVSSFDGSFDSQEVDKRCLLQVEITQVQVGICVHMRLVCWEQV